MSLYKTYESKLSIFESNRASGPNSSSKSRITLSSVMFPIATNNAANSLTVNSTVILRSHKLDLVRRFSICFSSFAHFKPFFLGNHFAPSATNFQVCSVWNYVSPSVRFRHNSSDIVRSLPVKVCFRNLEDDLVMNRCPQRPTFALFAILPRLNHRYFRLNGRTSLDSSVRCLSESCSDLGVMNTCFL